MNESNNFDIFIESTLQASVFVIFAFEFALSFAYIGLRNLTYLLTLFYIIFTLK
jgi:hypothetical protein